MSRGLVLLFVSHRCDVVEWGVASAVDVPVDEAHDFVAGVGVVTEAVLVEEFALEGREE